MGPNVADSGGGSVRDCGRLSALGANDIGGGGANTAEPWALAGYPGGGGGARPLAMEERAARGGRDMLS